MRDWNQIMGVHHGKSNWFSAYLWGIETQCGGVHIVGRAQVFSIPMRDWNSFLGWYCFQSVPYSFQHTYEGLKQRWLDISGTSKDVFSIPMRDWNSASLKKLGEAFGFSAYLWGIETGQAKATAERIWLVFSIPMRDWNLFNQILASRFGERFQHTYEGLKLLTELILASKAIGFQHTYEGLKLPLFKVLEFTFMRVFSIPMRDWNYARNVWLYSMYGSFQHTYEGLKLAVCLSVCGCISCFQHTYEGLKLAIGET